MSFYDYKEFIDWKKVKRSFGNSNDAIKQLKEDFTFYEELDDGEVIWHFQKWIKKSPIKLDEVLAKLDEELGYNIEDQGRS